MNEKQVEAEPATKKNLTLKEFVEDHQKLIAVAGVFVALGLFWKSVYTDGQVPYVSYLCFFITIPLFIEIAKDYKYENSSWNLIFFQQIFAGIFLFGLTYITSQYVEHTVTLVAGFLWFGIFTFLNYLAEKAASWFKNHEYNWALTQQEEINAMGLPVDKRNDLIEGLDRVLKKAYLAADAFGLLGLILSLILSFLIAGYTHILLAAFIETQVQQKQVEKVDPPQDRPTHEILYPVGN